MPPTVEIPGFGDPGVESVMTPLPPKPPSRAQLAEYTPQTSMSSNDDPVRMVEAATARSWRAAVNALHGLDAPAAIQSFNNAVSDLSTNLQVSNGITATVKAIVEDQDLPADRRIQKAAEKLNDYEVATKARADNAQANLTVMSAMLEVAALPPAPASLEAERLLREDLRVRLGTRSGPELVSELSRLATGPDRKLAGAIVHSSLVDALLGNLSEKDAREAKASIRLMAVEGSRRHGEGNQRKAAEARLLAMPEAQKMLAARRTSVSLRLQAARDMVPR